MLSVTRVVRTSVGMYVSVYMCSFVCVVVFFFKQKTAYEMRISDWSSDVCSSDLRHLPAGRLGRYRVQLRLPRRELHAVLRSGRAGAARRRREIGRASCRERVCQYV